MPLILCHSPKGGVGTSFIAAQIAIQLAARGHEISVLDFTWQDTLKLFFGLLPTQALPDMADMAADPIAVAGVELFSAYNLARTPSFAEALQQGDRSPFHSNRVYIADVAAGDRDTRDMLLPHALLHLCTLHPRPASLAVLPKVQPGTPTVDLPRTLFVLNHIDDTHRLSRHSHIFMRELVGDRLAGTVRRDEAVNEAAAMFEPLARFAPASVALADLEKLAKAVEQRAGLPRPAEKAV